MSDDAVIRDALETERSVALRGRYAANVVRIGAAIAALDRLTARLADAEDLAAENYDEIVARGRKLQAALARVETLREALERCARWPLESTRFELSKYADAVLAAVTEPDQQDESASHASEVAARLGPNREGLRSPRPGESSKPGSVTAREVLVEEPGGALCLCGHPETRHEQGSGGTACRLCGCVGFITAEPGGGGLLPSSTETETQP